MKPSTTFSILCTPELPIRIANNKSRRFALRISKTDIATTVVATIKE